MALMVNHARVICPVLLMLNISSSTDCKHIEVNMNTTTKRFPRTLAEAFPNSLESSQARAAYGCSITRYKGNSYAHVWVPPLCVAFFIGFLAGVLLCR